MLKAVARQRIAAGQDELDLDLRPPPQADWAAAGRGLEDGHLWDALSAA